MRKSFTALSAALLLGIGIVPSAEAFTLDIIPERDVVSLGTTFTADVRVSDLVDGGAPSIGSFDLSILIDGPILTVTDVTFGPGLNLAGFGTIDAVDISPGLLNVFQVSLDSDADLNTLQPGAFTLFTITFLATDVGTTGLGFDALTISSADGVSLLPDDRDTVFVAVTPVPLPAAGWLLLSAVAGVGVFRSRRGSARG